MTNFSAFSKDYLQSVIEPFLPGGTAHVTPIKYQAITPDIFALLFRTTGRDRTDHYFVALEYDYLKDMNAARQVTTEWCGSAVREYVRPAQAGDIDQEDIEVMRAPTTEPYFVLMACIDRPTNLGYWSENIVLLPGDDITEKLASFTPKQIAFVQTFVADHSKAKKQADHINTSAYAIAVYRKSDGSLELFYK